jgi:aldehyde dehydrogenase (NAD+)
MNKFLAMLIPKIKGTSASMDMGIMVNEKEARRVEQLILQAGGKILLGGKVDSASRKVEPTVILEPLKTASIMQDEIFGPLFPICGYKEIINEVINFINDRPHPLAVYYFGEIDGKVANQLAD